MNLTRRTKIKENDKTRYYFEIREKLTKIATKPTPIVCTAILLGSTPLMKREAKVNFYNVTSVTKSTLFTL